MVAYAKQQSQNNVRPHHVAFKPLFKDESQILYLLDHFYLIFRTRFDNVDC
jgi:hypothetical protein